MTENINPKILRRFQKLMALAERGDGGEKLNAQSALDKLLTKHGLTLNDLAGEGVTIKHELPFKSVMERRLLSQVIQMVVGVDVTIYIHAQREVLSYECTNGQQKEITIFYGILRKSLVKELELAFTAFIHANGVFPEDAKQDQQDEIDPVHLEKLMRRISAIDKTPLHEGLEHPDYQV